eukprot:TRINITY_DN10930_c0_g1_i2.p1 TRINITY_DN10930_c0_g1~~TRINITY_DN10930_c0_g1_i2.p1  ORF type:complete len:471 (+),score=69.73 TRINITY_DN10930_c0_g1_i2:136-1548(+)
MGLSGAAFISLLLPFDVANKKDPTIRNDTGGGLDLELLWQMTLWAVLGMVIVVLPFALYYYEAWDPDSEGATITREYTEGGDSQFSIIGRQITSGICWTLATIIIFAGMLLICYYAAGIDEALLPYTALKCSGQEVQLESCPRLANISSCTDVDSASYAVQCVSTTGTLHVKVSLFVATVAVLTCVGWVLFVVFGGVGLASLPLDMAYSFIENKLVSMTREDFAAERERIKHETRELLGLSERILEKLKTNKSQQKKVTALQVSVEKLEKEHRRNQAYNKKSEFAKLTSPFIIYGRLLLAMFCAAWSIMWLVHIIVNNTLDVHPVLNNLFIALDSAFSLLGVITYMSFSFYLLWATVNGCLHVGMNFLVFTIHPMKPGSTLLSSFIFNTILILLASVACVSFCAMSFRQYAANTVVDTLYASYVSKMKYLSYVMEYLQYGLLGFAALSLCWYSLKGPKSLKQLLEEQDDD